MRKLILAILMIPFLSFAGTEYRGGSGSGSLDKRLVSELPTCTAELTGRSYTVTDCTAVNNCSSGGGSAVEIVTCSGAAWQVQGDGTAGAGDGVPGGSATNLQFHVNATTFGGVTGTACSGSDCSMTGEFDIGRLQLSAAECLDATSTNNPFIDHACDGLTVGTDFHIRADIIDWDPAASGTTTAGLREALSRCSTTGKCVIKQRPNTAYLINDAAAFLENGGVAHLCDCVDDDDCNNGSDADNECSDIYIEGSPGSTFGFSGDIPEVTGNWPTLTTWDNITRGGMRNMNININDTCNTGDAGVQVGDCGCESHGCTSFAVLASDNAKDLIFENNTVNITEAVDGADNDDYHSWRAFHLGGTTCNKPSQRIKILNNYISVSADGITAKTATDGGAECSTFGPIIANNTFSIENKPIGTSEGPTKCEFVAVNGYGAIVADNFFDMRKVWSGNPNSPCAAIMAFAETTGGGSDEDVTSGFTITGNQILGIGASSRSWGIRVEGAANGVIANNVLQAGMCSTADQSCHEDGECPGVETCEPTTTYGLLFRSNPDNNEAGNRGWVISDNVFGQGANGDGGWFDLSDSSSIAPFVFWDGNTAQTDPTEGRDNIVANNIFAVASGDGFAACDDGTCAEAEVAGHFARNSVYGNIAAGAARGVIPFDANPLIRNNLSLRLGELTANGANYYSLKGPASIATDLNISLDLSNASTCTGDSNGGSLTLTGTSPNFTMTCSTDDGGAGGPGDISIVGNCTTGDCFQSGATDADTDATIYVGQSFTIELDDDNNGSNSFIVRDGAGTAVLTMAEAGTLTLGGTGTLTDVDALGGTTEATIEGQVFDTDAQSITGVWEVADDTQFQIGTASDWRFEYDNGVDDQLLVATNNNGAIATTDPMFEILADFDTANGTNMVADQQVFGVAKGTQASNVPLFTVDEDGDVNATTYTAADPGDGTRGMDFLQNTAAIGAPAASYCRIGFVGTTLNKHCNGGGLTSLEAGTGDVTAVGDCLGGGGPCFTGADGVTLTSENSDTFDMTTDAQFKFGRNDAGIVTITTSDNDANADTVVRAGGTGTLTLGNASNQDIILITDGANVNDAEWSLLDGGLALSEIGTFDSSTLSGRLTDERGSGAAVFAISVVTNKTGNATLTETECQNGLITNSGAAGAITLTLPANPSTGLTCSVFLATAQDVDVDVQGTTGCTIGAACDRILRDTNANGDKMSSDTTVGSILTLTAISSDNWAVMGIRGTWADAD